MKNLTKIITRILLIVCVVCLYENGIRFLYEDYRETTIYTNKDREQVEGRIETLVLGTSTAQRGFEPEILNEELDTISFNLASSLQPLDGTYALLRDVDKSNPVKRLFLSVTPQMMEKADVSTMAKSLVYSRLSGADSRISYLTYGCKLEEIPYLTLYSARVEDYLDFSFVKKNVSMKFTEEFKQGNTYKKSYKGNGRIAWKQTYQPEKNSKSEDKIFVADEQQELYLKKTITYCREHNIELILTLIPQTSDALGRYQNLQDINEYFSDLADEYQVCYWDFNYYNNAEELFSNNMFEDSKHLNKEGGDVFTKEFARTYNTLQAGENVGKLFRETSPYLAEQER